MNENIQKTKDILMQQMELLHKESLEASGYDKIRELVSISQAIAEISKTLLLCEQMHC